MKNKTVEFYNTYWRRVDAHREDLWKAWWAEGYARLESLAEPLDGKRVLMLGAGPGVEAAAYARRGARVVALDAAMSSVILCAEKARAENLEDHLTAIAGDAEALPFRDAAFDTVLVLNMIMHTDADRVVAECQRLLKPGGFWGLIEPLRYPHVAIVARWLEPHRRRTFVRYVRVADIVRWGRGAAWCSHREFFLLSTLVIMARRLLPDWQFLERCMAAVCRADRWILAHCAPLRSVAYLVVAGYRP